VAQLLPHFTGEHAKPEIAKKVHESPHAITYVLAILAALSAIADFLRRVVAPLRGTGEPLLEEWLHPSPARRGPLPRARARLRVRAHGALGRSRGRLVVRRARQIRSEPRTRLADQEATLPLFEAIQNKYWVDEIYQATIIGWALKLRLVLSDMDRWVVDGLVNGAGILAKGAAWVTGAIDHYLVDGAVNFVAEGTLAAGNRFAKSRPAASNRTSTASSWRRVFAIIQYFLVK